MADIATLGLAVDSSPVDKATESLGKFAGAARQTEAAARAITAASVAAAKAKYSEASAFLAAARASGTATAEEIAAAGASKRVAAAALEAARALHAQEGAALSAAKAVDLQAAASNQNAVVAKSGAHNVANLAAQFQDVAVTAAMGMSPLQIALQQGTQLSAVLGPMGAAGAVRSLGAAFVSVISVTSLLVIGVVALVAAGLQMINWAKVGATVLTYLADILPRIADTAAVAGAAILIAFGPAILSGIVSMTYAIGVGLVNALLAAAAAAYANPYVALAAAFVVVVTAAYVFRDELAKILGVDISSAVKTGANVIIGGMVGAYDAIMATWQSFPAALGDLGYQAAQGFLNALTNMAREAIVTVNSLIAQINGKLRSVGIAGGLGIDSIGTPMSMVPNVDLGNPYAGAAGGVSGSASAAFKAAQGKDYVGQIGGAISSAASDASGALKGLSAQIAGAGSEADKTGKAARGAGSAIKDAANGGKDAWKGLRDETAAANDNMKEAKGVVGGFLSDLRSGLKNGEGFWQSFSKAASNALDKIIDKIQDQLVDALFSAGSAGGGAGGGGLFGKLLGLFGGSGGSASASTVAASALNTTGSLGFYAGGTSFAPGGPAIVGEKGPELVNLPRGSRVTPNHRLSAAMGGGRPAPSVSIGGATVIIQGNADSATVAQMKSALEQNNMEQNKKAQREFGSMANRYRSLKG